MATDAQVEAVVDAQEAFFSAFDDLEAEYHQMECTSVDEIDMFVQEIHSLLSVVIRLRAALSQMSPE